MTEVCRTCLEEIDKDSITFCLNSTDIKSKAIALGNKLTYCIPEMDLEAVPNAVICKACFESLTVAHAFKTKCLKTEGRIQSYIEQTDYVLTCINLRDIVQREAHHDSLLDLKCDFDVPKIAQLLADDDKRQIDSCIHKCTKCDYRSAKRQTLIVHMRKHSDKEVMVQKAPQRVGYKKLTPKVYKCMFCEYSSTRSKSLNLHLQVHLKTKLYTCTFCQYSSASKFSFLQHMSDHNRHKALHCLHCGYETMGKADLQLHMHLHTFDFGRIDDTSVAVNNVT